MMNPITTSSPDLIPLTEPTLIDQIGHQPSAHNGITATFTATLKMEFSINIPESNLLNITQEVVRNIWWLKTYMDLYIVHLQGGISEEEFESEAEKYVRVKNHLSIDNIKLCSIYLKSILPDIEIEDVASLLNIDFADVARIMQGE